MNNNILSFKENISKIKDAKSFYIKKISLKNFRNHKSLNLNLKNSSILIYGGNGSGKTNIGKGLKLGRDGFKVVNQDIFIEAEKVKLSLDICIAR